MNQLEHGLYPFSETNLENVSRTLIDFSRSLDFTFNTFIPKISKVKRLSFLIRDKKIEGDTILVVFILLLTLTDKYP